MARQNFSVITNNTPSIDGVFAVNLMIGSGSDPIKDGPHEYIVGETVLPTSKQSWDGRLVKWTVDINGKPYHFTGDFSSGGKPFAGTVTWKDPEEGEDGWQAGAGEPGEDEELSATA